MNNIISKKGKKKKKKEKGTLKFVHIFKVTTKTFLNGATVVVTTKDVTEIFSSERKRNICKHIMHIRFSKKVADSCFERSFLLGILTPPRHGGSLRTSYRKIALAPTSNVRIFWFFANEIWKWLVCQKTKQV